MVLVSQNGQFLCLATHVKISQVVASVQTSCQQVVEQAVNNL